MVWPARLVTPAIVMVHEAVALAIVTALKATVSGVPCVTTLVLPAQPAPKVMVGAGPVQRKEAGQGLGEGNALCADWCRVGQRQDQVGGGPVVDRGTAQVLVRVGATVLTTTRPVTPLVTLVVPVMLAAALVKAAGLLRTGGVGLARPVGHPGNRDGARGRRWPSSRALKATVSGVPCVTVELPAQPAPKVMVGAAEVQRKARGQGLGEGNPRLRRVGALLVSVLGDQVGGGPVVDRGTAPGLGGLGATVLTSRTDQSRRW